MRDGGSGRNTQRPSTSNSVKRMGQELIDLRTELNEVRSELRGVAHLRAEIAELTAALR